MCTMARRIVLLLVVFHVVCSRLVVSSCVSVVPIVSVVWGSMLGVSLRHGKYRHCQRFCDGWKLAVYMFARAEGSTLVEDEELDDCGR